SPSVFPFPLWRKRKKISRLLRSLRRQDESRLNRGGAAISIWRAEQARGLCPSVFPFPLWRKRKKISRLLRSLRRQDESRLNRGGAAISIWRAEQARGLCSRFSYPTGCLDNSRP
uniref:Uncharacterized protein n=1 Tax=Oryza meridionalis TaxID=40149 RepID=A0A0E0C8J9_9ORYZ